MKNIVALSWVSARIYTRFQGVCGGNLQVDSSANLNSPVIVVDAKVSGGIANEIWRKEGKRLRKHRSRRWVIVKHARSFLYSLMIASDIFYWLLFIRFLLNESLNTLSLSLLSRCFSPERVKGTGMSGIGLSGGFRVRKETRERVIGQSDDTAPDSSNVSWFRLVLMDYETG